MNYANASQLILGAKRPEDVFGERIDDHDRWMAAADKLYKELARAVHPDVAPDPDAAHEVFARLSELWRQVEATVPGATFTVSTKRRTYEAGRLVAHGSVANLYACAYFPDATSGDAAVDDLLKLRARLKGEAAPASESAELQDAVLKMPRSPKNNDLIVAEAKAIGVMRADTDRNAKLGAFIPTLVESFQHRDRATGQQRLCNVFDQLEGFYTLTDVAKLKGWVHPKDVAWMWRRLYVALHFAHANGIVHGAVIPDNVMIHPELHGLVLVDWCYSVQAGDPLKAKVKKATRFYPTWPDAEGDVGTDFDLFMAAQTMASLMDPAQLPRGLKGFVKMCTHPGVRPTEALTLRDQFDELLEEMWGPRTFRPFSVG